MNMAVRYSQEDEKLLKVSRETLQAAKAEQNQWLTTWRKLNEAFYPFLYNNLFNSTALSPKQPDKIVNPKLLDGEPALALLVLASGFMNGVTSPARKWLNVKKPGNRPYEKKDLTGSPRHSETRTKLLEILSGTNYYDTRAMQVYDAAGLGTGVHLCYEDRDSVVRFMLCPPGSYYLITDTSNKIVGFGREFRMKLRDIAKEFGRHVLSKDMLNKVDAGGAQANATYLVCHLIEENDPNQTGAIKTNHPFRELYWLGAKMEGAACFLAKRPLYEWPVSTLRWSCPDDSTYGIPPTLSVLGKTIQLQNLEYQSDQGLDKMIAPPMLAHTSMKNRPKAFAARGITYTNDLSAANGARPAYQVQVPFQELEIKRQRIIQAIKDGCYNYLFNGISDLDTVRSATEIDARREERLIVLGPVLQRGYMEDLAITIKRVYGIAVRKKVIEPFSSEEEAEIEFSNILSEVQKASDVATLERFTAFAGQVIPAWPEVQAKVNILDIITQYAESLGVRPTVLNEDENVVNAADQQGQMQQLQQMSEVAKNFGAAGQSLGNVDVGGGINAVQSLLA